MNLTPAPGPSIAHDDAVVTVRVTYRPQARPDDAQIAVEHGPAPDSPAYITALDRAILSLLQHRVERYEALHPVAEAATAEAAPATLRERMTRLLGGTAASAR